MSFLDRAIKRGISNAIGNGVEQGVRQAVAPKIEKTAANVVNSAASQIKQAAGTQDQQTARQQNTVSQAETAQAASTLGGLFGGLTAYANEAAKNMKICPSCGESTGKDVKYCPKCGAKMPETTLGDGVICPSCGKQNQIGTKFCADCGTKLPVAVQEEQAAQAADGAVMAQWDEKLPQYPKWCFGGKNFHMEEHDGCILFAVKMESRISAQNCVKQYRDLLLQNGFRQAGEHPNIDHLYKMVNGDCCHCDTEHCFDGDEDCPVFNFSIEEPTGGFNYVKPEPRKATSFKDLFKF